MSQVRLSFEGTDAVIEFVQKVQEFQAGPKAIGKIVVIPEEGDRIPLDNPGGDELVKKISEGICAGGSAIGVGGGAG